MTDLFRGYVPTNNKKCLMKFKNKELLTLDQVKDKDEYAGILAPGIILIDIDDKKQSDLLMDIVEELQLDCRVYQTTRGRHFFFKNNDDLVKSCKTKTKLACGLTADIKLGTRNSYSVLKFNGKERWIEWDVEEGHDYQTMPKWLMPVNSTIDFDKLGEGDGRNQALFGYILKLVGAGMSKEDAKDTIKLINKYILKNPLSDSEIDTITRDDAFPEEDHIWFTDNGAFLHDAFAQFLTKNCNVKKVSGQLHVYDNGVYLAGSERIEALMIKHIPQLKAQQRTEVLKYMNIIAEEVSQADANLIAFRNGVYNLATGELTPFDPDIIVTNKIDYNFNKGAYSELADKTLNKMACDNKEVRALLEECIGYCFYRRNELSKAFVLTGEKSNGKSTFLDMVSNLLGENNVSALDLSELDERFSVATLSGKLANIGDDISDEFLQGRSVANFKKIVSGNQVKAEFKGQDPFFFNPYVKLLFSANDIPRMKDKTGAVLRRLVIIPFNATFSKDDPDFDPYITWKLKNEDVMEYLIQIGLNGLKRVLENSGFTESDLVKKSIEQYEIDNNPILLFLQEKERHEIVNQPTKDVHKAYRAFCLEQGFSEMTLANLSKQLNRYLGVVVKRVRVDGKQIGMYVMG